MNPNGESKNTFGPKPKSTPNNVGVNESIPRKTGKGKITGGIEEDDIFTSIQYTGNTADASTKITNSQTYNKKVFDQIDYTFGSTGFGEEGKGDGVFGSAKFAAGAKSKTVSGEDEMDEGSVKYVGTPTNKRKEHLKPEAKFNGKNPNDLNIKGKTKSPFRG